jgi:hypothetical protein
LPYSYEPLVLSYATSAPQILNATKMVRVAGVEPAWTCAQDMWVAATLHPDIRLRVLLAMTKFVAIESRYREAVSVTVSRRFQTMKLAVVDA